MTPEIWQRVEAIAGPALDMSVQERRLFLAEACAGDRELLEEVGKLLEAADSADGFLDRPEWSLWKGSGAQSAVLGELREGRLVGSYRVGRVLGRGGMGAVYLAHRADESFEKRVALKLVREPDDPSLERRFQRERDILARLEHPYIARLYDAGTTEEGQPYFVLEYVRGVPIDEFCEERELGLEERLAVFLRICEGVHFAHRNLVVHRDLKPGNILVADDGTPKLLDFGIAKLLSHAEDGRAAATATSSRPLTPLYASPEQVQGQGVSTATDVYALGLLLFRLLTGRSLFADYTSEPARLARAIAEEEAPPPSEFVRRGEGREPTTRNRRAQAARIAGDLDSIVLKTLRKEPERRYGSVLELAEDLRRYLGGFPVSARRGTTLYLLAKFLRRNRWPAVAATVLLASLLGYGVLTLIQSRRIAEERDRARAVEEFLIDAFGQADPLENGGSVSARQILDRSAERISEGLAAGPLVQASLQRAMGRAYLGLGILDQAEEQLRQAHLLEESAGRRSPVTLLALARTHLARNELQEAAGHAQEVLATSSPRDPAASAARREARRVLADVARERNDWGEALRLLQENQRRDEAGGAASGPELVETLLDLARLSTERTFFGEAEEFFEGALALQRARYGDSSMEVALILAQQADLAIYQFQGLRGRQLAETALEVLEPRLGRHHPKVLEVRSQLAIALGYLFEWEEAEAIHRELLEDSLRRLGEDHPVTAVHWNNLATVLADTGRTDAAEPLFRRALQVLEGQFRPNHRKVAFLRTQYGGALRKLGRPEEARRELLKSVSALSSLPRAEAAGAAFPLEGLAELEFSLVNLPAAEGYLRQALEAHRRHPDAGEARLARLQAKLARALLAQDRDTEEVELLLLSSMAAFERLLPPGHPNHRILRQSLAQLYCRQGRYVEAEEQGRQAALAHRGPGTERGPSEGS